MDDDCPVVPGYTLVHRVGAGASGEVWRARRQADDLLVALKIVPARDGDLGQALREAAVLSRVRHPHLLHLYDVLPLPDPDGRPASLGLAVQFAAGGSLAQVLEARRLLTAGELVTLVSPVAGALADLHRVGVVHGDVSAGNVVFLSDGMPMLADLGVSRLVGERLEEVHGTDGMVAPEVVEGFPPGPEADVYALGALAWLCLTGQQPGWVGTRHDLVDLAPEISEGIRELVQRCLAPEPEDRPEAEEVATVVLGLAQPEPIEVAPDADPGLSLTRRLRAAARADEEEDPVPQRGRRRGPLPRHRAARVRPGGGDTRRRRGTMAAGALVVGVGVVVLAWTLGPAARAPADLVTAATENPDAQTPDAGTRGAETRGAEASPSPEPATVDALDDPPPTVDETIDEPVDTLQGLVDARAHAWESGDPEALAMALAARSPALAADSADLGEAAAAGVDYAGVEFTVVTAEVDSAAQPTASGDAVRLVGTVARAPLTVRGPGGATQTGAAVHDVVWELRRMDNGWRIWSWE